MEPEQLAKSGSEDGEQAALFCWAAQQVRDNIIPELDLMFAIPNGGARNIRTAVTLKATGVKAGVSDIFLPVARHGVHGLFIELKKVKGGKVSEEQQSFGESMHQQGYGFCVCHGWLQARDTILQYFTD